ncbi:MAG: hypothetical protein QG656_1025, partial [Candidatus Hydrogenedentes bacterium]|nr:hypothetical protein [Candidatus Hydrogenedentota bacterium]
MAIVLLGLVLSATQEVPAAFEMPFTATGESEARVWQEKARTRLLDLVEAQNPRTDKPLDVEIGPAEDKEGYSQADLRFTGNEGDRIEATLTVPKGGGPFPAIVTLHGHGGNRFKVHDPETEYRGFAADYARRGFVTLSPTLGHCTYAANQLWNLMRLVDVVETLPSVDRDRIGVAGLSMGGEWTMWLAVCDLRIKAAVVSGWMCSTEGV